MQLKKWEDLPEYIKNDEVKFYYDILCKKRVSMFFKRLFDIIISLFLLFILFIPMVIIGIAIKLDSNGPIFYRQKRVTQYGKCFRIHKFRTMIVDAEQKGSEITTKNDDRITCIGRKLRGLRLDELPQLIDILQGNMTLVGTRPETIKYVKCYTDEMYATLLLPAGVTSLASIKFKDESKLMSSGDNIDKKYIDEILPRKMNINLKQLQEFSLKHDIKIICMTAWEVFKR